MKVLLSPAKKIDTSKGLQSDEYSVPIFIDKSSYLINKLKKMSSNKISKMMHLSKDLSDLNYERYQNWEASFSPTKNTCIVSAAFDGEVYRGLDVLSFSKQELAIAQNRIRILSGLYGLLKPLDIIHPYRLEMGTKWSVTPSKSNLYKYWGNQIAAELNKEIDDGILVNLASTEYFKAVDRKTLNAHVITPVFKEFKNGEYKVVMVFAKRARGLMAKYIVKNNVVNPEELKLFNTDGYQYDVNLSEGDNWVFTR